MLDIYIQIMRSNVFPMFFISYSPETNHHKSLNYIHVVSYQEQFLDARVKN